MLGLHPTTHCPFTHTFPCDAQFMHAPPPTPHALSSPPGAQRLPLQQPTLHAGNVQKGGDSHIPPPPKSMQLCPAPHGLHVSPYMPHAPSDVPSWQVVPSQQPWHVAGSQ
jgi:hypothetical protein